MKFMYYCLLFVTCFIHYGNIEVYAQKANLLPAPKWEVGDWWVVEVEMYNSCDVGPSSCTSGWEGPYRYRFEVESREELDGDDYFVVFIKLIWDVEYYSNGGKSEGPTQYGDCYRVWYRTTDRFLGRYVEYEQWRNKQQVKRRQLDFDPARPVPIMMFYLTKVPVTIPIFEVQQAKTAFTIKNAPPRATSLPSAVSQKKYYSQGKELVQEIRQAVEGEVFQFIPPFLKNWALIDSTHQSSMYITIQNIHTKRRNVQYWNTKFPWYITAKKESYIKSIGEYRAFKHCLLLEFGKK